MLTGSELLARVKELGDISKSEPVPSCGHVRTQKDGHEPINFTAFHEALLDAKGISLGDGDSRGRGKAGRKLSYTATLDRQPGKEFEIKLGKQQIRLVPVRGSDEEDQKRVSLDRPLRFVATAWQPRQAGAALEEADFS